ncbi:MAG: nucleoside monophosphate kinase [Holosporales bacterium]|jgi:adenylate kinase|nr:nucleoside monophosphate kinase [Holosporales bacterium]
MNCVGKWIVFLGAPGCGKGTQAESLVSENNFTVVSMGDILRENKTKSVAAYDGMTIGEIIGNGILLPDEIVMGLVKDELKKIDSVVNRNLLFDGIPRTIGQAESLSLLAEEFKKKIDKVLNFVIDDEIIFKRILGRYKCSKCGKIYNDFFLSPKVSGVCDVCGGNKFDRRTDDNEESLKKRLSEYHSKTHILIDFYSKLGMLYNVNANDDPQKVREFVLDSLNAKKES